MCFVNFSRGLLAYRCGETEAKGDPDTSHKELGLSQRPHVAATCGAPVLQGNILSRDRWNAICSQLLMFTIGLLLETDRFAKHAQH